MPEPVLDTMVLQALGFGHPRGLTILQAALSIARLRVPAEIYNQDEDVVPLDRGDRGISEFGRGIRFARRQVDELPAPDGARYQHWLVNAQQIARHITDEELVVTSLTIEELQYRDALTASYGIGRGEAACLALAQREQSAALFISSDDQACKVAQAITVPYLTLVDVLEQWITTVRPSMDLFEELIAGMASARFRVSAADDERLRMLVRGEP